jgi:N,N-dimethylformamidase
LMSEMNGFGDRGATTWDLADASDPDSAPASRAGVAALQLTNAPARSGVIPAPVDDSGRALAAPGAIHFHRDDTEDCRWPVATEIAVPSDARTGFYSARLRSGDQEFELPFIVSGRSAVTLLAPTLTWQAYANLGRHPDVWPGRSHYSVHTDGSPVFVTTSRKPTPTFAPDARVQVDEADGFLADNGVTHLLMADLYAEYWLTGFGTHAVMDDRDLHRGGLAALDGVRAIVLSAHPEYWTASMLDAIDAFLERGGSLICLGGNGLYWVTSLHPDKPHLMEVRRWAGSQTSSAAASERMHQFEPRRGGTWTEAGRPPNRILGVSFAGFGGGDPMPYRRTQQSYDEQWSWVFDGVDELVVGAHGLNTGAGNEFDRFDETRVTAGTTVVLATSQPAGADAFGAYEELGVRAPHERVRADMTITRTAAGGLVFSLSSITASGCLPASSPDQGLSRICSNVLNRMLRGA